MLDAREEPLKPSNQPMKSTAKTFASSLAPLRDNFSLLERNPIVAYLCLVRLMKTTLCSTFVAMILATMLFSSGCEKKTAATNPSSESTRGSTKPLEAVDLVGYDGKSLRRSVDRIKEANEKHNHQIEKMTESGPDQ